MSGGVGTLEKVVATASSLRHTEGMEATQFPRRNDITKPKLFPVARKCVRCGGTGIYSQFHGTCYRCGGLGQDPKDERVRHFPADWSNEQCQAHEDKLEAKRVARAEKKHNARQERFARQCEAIPALATLRKWQDASPVWDADRGEMTDGDETWFMVGTVASDIMFKAFDYDLSEKQIAVLEREVAQVTERTAKKAEREAQWAAEAEAAEDAPEGRVTITGRVIKTFVKETQYGTQYKIMVKLDTGARIYMSSPKSVPFETGITITGTVTVERSEDDSKFGFGKRPSKFEVVS